MVDGDKDTLLDGVTATIKDGRIELTNLSPLLASKGRLSIWVSGKKWRICVTIEWGVFTSSDGQIQVKLPDLDAHTAVFFTHTEVTTPTRPLPGGVRRLLNFRLNAVNDQGAEIKQFDKSFTLELRYSVEDLEKAGITEESLQIAFFDEESDQWVLLETEVDTEAKIARTTLDHLTEFALWGEVDETVKTYPIFLPVLNR
jgi:hypothetical protein